METTELTIEAVFTNEIIMCMEREVTNVTTDFYLGKITQKQMNESYNEQLVVTLIPKLSTETISDETRNKIRKMNMTDGFEIEKSQQAHFRINNVKIDVVISEESGLNISTLKTLGKLATDYKADNLEFLKKLFEQYVIKHDAMTALINDMHARGQRKCGLIISGGA